MGKRPHHATLRKPEQGGTSGGKLIPHALSKGEAHKRLNQVEAIWEFFPEGLIACDRNQRIARINAAARKLFEVGSENRCLGRDYQQFLTSYVRSDEQPSCVSSEQWLINLAFAGETGTFSPAQALLLHLPSGRKSSVMVHSFAVSAQGHEEEETILVFHSWPKIFHLQCVHKAMLDLITATALLPEQMDHILPEETFLLSSPVLFVAQQVVDVVRSVLDCFRVVMVAFGRRTNYLYFVAGSGLTTEQEQYWRDIGGRFHLSELLDNAAFTRLGTNQEVMLAMDQLHTIEHLGKQLPFPEYLHSVSPSSETVLLFPLFLEQQWVGVLYVVKVSSEEAYTPEAIALAKTVSAQTMLFIEGIHCLCAQGERQNKALIQCEMSRLASEFLNLASHELCTPLTGIMGNLQLAQRRLKTLKDQFTPLSAQMCQSLAYVQQPLADATQSARLQQRMINDLIDDARIQTNTLPFSLNPEDLGTLLREVVARQQHAAPEHPIVLDVPPLEQGISILADARRIKYVLITYLTNALTSSPPGQPVEVQLRVEETLARVSVHNEGAGIAKEDLDHLWERFYRTKGKAVQHEQDLSFGLPLYLCRAFIERHGGSVGVQSTPGQGATFWFTLPITPSRGT